MELENGVLDLLIVTDRCSVEVFAQGGKVVLTDLIFPNPDDRENRISADAGSATVTKLALSTIDLPTDRHRLIDGTPRFFGFSNRPLKSRGSNTSQSPPR